jgi:CO/xanthine dehydrogenase FAD-binding subunit
MRMIRPRDLDGALDALASNPGATLLAGGTDLMVEVNLQHRRPETVIALRRVRELRERDRDFIGAGVTWQELAAEAPPALAELARTVGSPQIRAAGTLGGNLGTASPAGDALPFLAISEARVVLASVDGLRELRWDEFLTGPKTTARRGTELILGIALPDVISDRQAAAKVGVRQAMVISTVSCGVLRTRDGATRVALGAVGPTVLRIPAAEELLGGIDRLSAETLTEFERRVRVGVAPITDHRATAAYRRHAAGVLARRTLERCLRG